MSLSADDRLCLIDVFVSSVFMVSVDFSEHAVGTTIRFQSPPLCLSSPRVGLQFYLKSTISFHSHTCTLIPEPLPHRNMTLHQPASPLIIHHCFRQNLHPSRGGREAARVPTTPFWCEVSQTSVLELRRGGANPGGFWHPQVQATPNTKRSRRHL